MENLLKEFEVNARIILRMCIKYYDCQVVHWKQRIEAGDSSSSATLMPIHYQQLLDDIVDQFFEHMSVIVPTAEFQEMKRN
jgi:hypothetical protein